MEWKEIEWNGRRWNGQKKISGAVAGQSLMIALSFEGAWVRMSERVIIFPNIFPMFVFGRPFDVQMDVRYGRLMERTFGRSMMVRITST